MSKLTFYFDPICPWTWRAAEWIREVQRQEPLEVEWKFFSLSEANNFGGDSWLVPLRVAALVRRNGGNQAVNEVYRAMGQNIHDRGANIREEGVLEMVAQQALSESGLDPALLQQALADPSTREEVLTEHAEAVSKYKAYGVPWLVVEGQDFGFNGPVIDKVPQGQTALALWEHLSWMLTQPYFYELKRNRG